MHGQILEERDWTRDAPASATGVSLRCAVFKEEIHAAIVDGQQLEVSFDSFPYYLRYAPRPLCIILLHPILLIVLYTCGFLLVTLGTFDYLPHHVKCEKCQLKPVYACTKVKYGAVDTC